MAELALTVVMPAYAEADSLRLLLPRLLAALEALTPNFEVIVADALQPVDDTKAVCEAAGVLHLPRTGGNMYGDAVRSGIARSRGTHVLLMDSDGSHNPAELFKLWNEREQANIVIGSRYIKGGTTENPWILIAMSRVLNRVYEIAFRLPVADVSNSLRLYRGDQIRSLRLVSNNFDIVEEILIRLVVGKTQSTVMEVPITFEARKAGVSKRNLPAFMLSYVKSMRTMLRFRAEERLAAQKGTK